MTVFCVIACGVIHLGLILIAFGHEVIHLGAHAEQICHAGHLGIHTRGDSPEHFVSIVSQGTPWESMTQPGPTRAH